MSFIAAIQNSKTLVMGLSYPLTYSTSILVTKQAVRIIPKYKLILPQYEQLPIEQRLNISEHEFKTLFCLLNQVSSKVDFESIKSKIIRKIEPYLSDQSLTTDDIKEVIGFIAGKIIHKTLINVMDVGS